MTQRKDTSVPTYVGRAAHLWKANRRDIETLLQEAIQSGASEITLTLSLPDNAPAPKRIRVQHTAVLPISDGFRVVQTDGQGLYPQHTAATWEAACAWLAANRKPLPRNRIWSIYGTSGAGCDYDANLLRWDGQESSETPPTPVDREEAGTP